MSINTPREILQTQIATHNVTSPVGSEIMSNAAGRSRATNESVTVSSNNADITDALEELGMAKATRGKNDLDKMKVRKGQGADMEALGRIAEYYDKLPNLPSDQKSRDLVLKLQKFEELMQGGGGGGGSDMPTADDIRELLRQFDGDVSHQFAALEDARERFAAAGASESFLSMLDEVRAEMRTPDTAQDIKAGFASAREAVSTADRFATSPEAYRDSYRQMVRAGGHLGRVFDALGQFLQAGAKEAKGKGDYEAVVDSFIKVAGADMQSFGPTTDRAILGDVVAELKVLKNVRTVLDMGTNLATTLARMYPDEKAKVPSNVEIASNLFHFSSSGVASMNDAKKMIDQFDQTNPEVPVVALNMLRDMHANLPDSALPSDTARLQQSKVLMTLSDTLVAAEEAQYGG